MKKAWPIALLAVFFISVLWIGRGSSKPSPAEGAPPYDVTFEEPGDPRLPDWAQNWQRSDGPPRVGLQVGHWQNEELPEEQSQLRGSTGSVGGGKVEWEVNLAIAQATAEYLEEQGVTVDILPATVPTHYWADAFVAIHADGSDSSRTSGFKVATPWRDFSEQARLPSPAAQSAGGQAKRLAAAIEEAYGPATGLVQDPNISRNMRGYYAFAWWRYEHAVHPMTAAAILETGFLASPADRRVIVNQPDLAGQALASGIVKYLLAENLLPRSPG